MDSEIQDLSKNSTFDYIRKHPNMPWDMKIISSRNDVKLCHLNIETIDWDWTLVISISGERLGFIALSFIVPFKYIENHPDLPWNAEIFSMRKDLSMHHLKTRRLNWDWNLLSTSANITINDILNHPEFPWNYSNLFLNPNITRRDIAENPQIPW